MNEFLKRHPVRLAIYAIVLCCAAALAGAIFLMRASPAPEIGVILGSPDLSARATAYRALLERLGPVQAQEMLAASPLPRDGQGHLLDHVAGDYIYETYGLSGIRYCTDAFLEACYHQFFLRAIADHGALSIPEMMVACYAGTRATALQCAHGIGHGLVAWFGYAKLPDAVAYCDTLHGSDAHFPAENCYDGAFMENVYAVHENGAPSPDRWIRPDDDGFPCTDTRIKDIWRAACYSNQPALLYQQYEGNIEKVAAACADVPSAYRPICYDGLARQIHPLTLGSVAKARELCAKTGTEEADQCIISIARAARSVGDTRFPQALCASLEDSASCAAAVAHIAEIMGE